MDVDIRAALRWHRIDRVAEAANAVVSDDVPLAGELNSARVLDALRSRPGTGTFDHIVRHEPPANCVRVIRRHENPISDALHGAAAHDDASTAVARDAFATVADRQALEPEIEHFI